MVLYFLYYSSQKVARIRCFIYQNSKLKVRVGIMSKYNKSYIVMLVLLSQTILSITVGMFTLHMTSKEQILPGVYINTLSVGNCTKSEAVSMIKEHYDKPSDYSKLLIKYGYGKEYSINLSELEFSIDYEATVNEAYSIGNSSKFARIIKGFFSSDKKTVYPIVKLNEEKLEKQLKDLALLIDEAPVKAQMYFNKGELSKTPHESGIKLNISNSIKKIKNELGSHLDSAIEFNVRNTFEIDTVPPELTFEDLKGADCVISSYTTPINSPELKETVWEGANALNGFLIFGSSSNGEKSEEFSFLQRLKEKGLSFEQKNDGYSIVASTFYTALLKTGIDINCIDRTRHETPVDFIEPGLDVKVSVQNEDFKFINPFEFPIAVFSECNDESITVYIVGSKIPGYSESEMEVNITQRFEPPVLRVVNYDLKPEEEKIISSGKQGIEVEVHRVTKENGKKSSQRIYINKYDAIGAIMQVGPKIRPDNRTDK